MRTMFSSYIDRHAHIWQQMIACLSPCHEFIHCNQVTTTWQQCVLWEKVKMGWQIVDGYKASQGWPIFQFGLPPAHFLNYNSPDYVTGCCRLSLNLLPLVANYDNHLSYAVNIIIKVAISKIDRFLSSTGNFKEDDVHKWCLGVGRCYLPTSFVCNMWSSLYM